MAIVPSYFGYLAENQNLQAMIDNSQDVLAGQSIWRQYLEQGVPQASLTFETAIGRARIEAAASIVDPDAPAPLRSRNALELLTGKIPTMKEKFVLSQKEFRDLKVIEAMPISDQAKKAELIRVMWNDTQKAAVAGDKRVDMLLLQALSTLTVSCTIVDNPDGVVYGVVDLLPKGYQRQGVPIPWAANLTTATPIDDIENYVDFIRNTYGRTFGKIQMEKTLWLAFKKTTQVINRLQTFYNVGKANASFAVTLANVNEMFDANMWPMIEIVDHVSGVEKDGIVTPVRSFNVNNVSFQPNGKLGVLANAFAVEEWMKSASVSYATYGRTLVSKWMDNDPIREFTAMELNAFPVINVDEVFILKTDTTQANFNTVGS